MYGRELHMRNRWQRYAHRVTTQGKWKVKGIPSNHPCCFIFLSISTSLLAVRTASSKVVPTPKLPVFSLPLTFRPYSQRNSGLSSRLPCNEVCKDVAAPWEEFWEWMCVYAWDSPSTCKETTVKGGWKAVSVYSLHVGGREREREIKICC